MTKRMMLAALAVAVAGLFQAAPADAQYPEYRFDVGINGGFSGYTSMLDDDHLGEGSDDVRFARGWLLGLQATYWVTPRIGIRANGAYSERPVTQGGFFSSDEQSHQVDDVNLWTGSGDLLFRFAGPRPMFGNEAMPYLALGIGAKHFNPAGDHILNPNDPDEDHYEGLWFIPEGQTGQWAIVEETKLMGLIGLGTDIRMADNFALRLEIGDRIYDSPLRAAPEFAVNPDEDAGNVVHELYAQIGAHLLAGLRRPEVVAVTPAPPAPPAPQLAPEPEPVEERITVCVIDPGAENGIRMVDAIYLPDRRDTLVEVQGQRRALATTLPNVQLATSADWFVAGEPLAIELGRDMELEYTTWQAGRQISANELTYLGNIRGVPVYAATQDVSAVRQDFATARQQAGTNDLNRILADRRNLRTTLEDVEFLYVPLRATGCVFQTMQQVERVIKK